MGMAFGFLGFGIIAYLLVSALVARRKSPLTLDSSESIQAGGGIETLYDDIIAVRKAPQPQETKVILPVDTDAKAKQSNTSDKSKPPQVVVFHVMAQTDKQFVGYELLQSLLSLSLRFGDMSIFHRYQETSGQGPVMFSVTSATEPGTFDIKNMGSFATSGLTLFMQLSGNVTIDGERLDLMIATAKKLRTELNGQLLDSYRRPLTEQGLTRCRQALSSGVVGDASVA